MIGRNRSLEFAWSQGLYFVWRPDKKVELEMNNILSKQRLYRSTSTRDNLFVMTDADGPNPEVDVKVMWNAACMQYVLNAAGQWFPKRQGALLDYTLQFIMEYSAVGMRITALAPTVMGWHGNMKQQRTAVERERLSSIESLVCLGETSAQQVWARGAEISRRRFGKKISTNCHRLFDWTFKPASVYT